MKSAEQKAKNVPAIRFAGFEDEWVEKKMGDVAGVYDGVHQTPDYRNSGVMFLSVENISSLKSEKYISQDAFEKNYKVYPQKGDVLMTRIGDVGTPNVVESDEKIAYYVSLALLKPFDVDSYFLNDVIQSKTFQKRLKERTLLTAIPMKINKDEIGKVGIIHPIRKNEQRKIGSFFSNIDSLISLEQKKCDKLTQVKKSMLEKMFPKEGATVPEIRFAGFTGDWGKDSLDKLAIISKGCQINKSKLNKTGKYYVLNGGMSPSGFTDSFNTTGGTISISEGGNSCGFVMYNKHDFWSGGHNYTLSQLKLNGIYFYHFLKMREPFIMSLRVGSGLPNIQKSRLSEIIIFYPTESEQQKIGSYFSHLDSLISLQQRKLEKLKNIKKSLLEKMFV
jgi:type I restriction enzyme S subunit